MSVVLVCVCVCIYKMERGNRRHSQRHERSHVRRERAHSAFPGEGDEWLDSWRVRRDAGGAAERAGKQRT